MSVVFVEPNMDGTQHVSFNRDFLTCVSLLSDRDGKSVQPLLYCSAEHADSLGKVVESFSFNRIEVVNGQGRKFVLKFCRDLLNISRILLSAKRNGSKRVVFLSCFAPSFFLVSLLASLFRLNVTIIMHSEAEALLLDGSPLNFGSYRFWVKLYFSVAKFFQKRTEILVLGQHAYRDQLTASIVQKYKFGVIDHPFVLANRKSPTLLVPTCVNYQVAFVGYGRKERGIEIFMDLARLCQNAPGISFVVAGDIDSRIDVSAVSGNVAMPLLGRGFVGPEVIDDIIKQSRYIFLPYGKETYRLSSSGVIFDSLLYGKEILALRNPHFEELNERLGLGLHIFDRIEDVCDFLSRTTTEIQQECLLSVDAHVEHSQNSTLMKWLSNIAA